MFQRMWIASLFLLLGFLTSAWGNIAVPANVLAVPIVRQSTDYSCGAAALSSLLRYWRVADVAESELFTALKVDPLNGSRNEDTVRVARAWGLSAEMRAGVTLSELESSLRQGKTIILDIQAWKGGEEPANWNQIWEDGHHVVLIGTDSANIYVMDPMLGSSYGFIPKEELYSRWHDYETVGGKIRRFERLAIFIEGKNPPLSRFPAVPIRLQ